MSSGSKKRPTAPPELADWQTEALAIVARSALAGEAVFGGGAALAAVYLHHRTSDDLDFFFSRELGADDLRPLARALARRGVTIDQRVLGPVRSMVLARNGQVFGKLDFAYYPYDPVGRRPLWERLRVESRLDMAVNKVQAVLTRFQPRDFVDLYFLLREGSEPDLDRLLDFTRAKFDQGAHPMTLAERLLLVHDIAELPRMIRPLAIAELVAFFEARARALLRGRIAKP